MSELDYLDEWVFVTTPKGEKINVNIHSDGQEDTIGIHLYEMETTNEGYDQTCSWPYDSITINKLRGDINGR
tara:strand:+ start:1979 stop:2194 length:216 start_codon:yes stop_codon:yes gene_type:complete